MRLSDLRHSPVAQSGFKASDRQTPDSSVQILSVFAPELTVGHEIDERLEFPLGKMGAH